MSKDLSPSLSDSSNKNTNTGEQKADSDSQPGSKSSESHRSEATHHSMSSGSTYKSVEKTTTLVPLDESGSTKQVQHLLIKYAMNRRSDWGSVSTISTTGRSHAKEWVLLQDKSGTARDLDNNFDPLDFGFNVKTIKVAEKLFVDESCKQEKTSKSLSSEQETELDVNYIFPQSKLTLSQTTNRIIHGPEEIFGMDDGKLVLCIVSSTHNELSTIYSWYLNYELIKSGLNYCIFYIEEEGKYHCTISVHGQTYTSRIVTAIDKKKQPEIPSLQKRTISIIPIIKLNDLSFRLEDEIGKEAFGSVFKGAWVGSAVAIKAIDCKRGKQKIRGMVEAEIEMHELIRHPNIVQLMAVAFEKSSVYLITKYINCFNMENVIFYEDLWSQLKLIHRNKILIIVQLLQAVCYLHAVVRPIIHRDIKPANILITEKRLVTNLCDLGVSRVKNVTSHCTTNIGGQPGTLAYMPPRASVQGKMATTASNIWAIGITMVEFFSGEEAWGDENVMDTIRMNRLPESFNKLQKPVKNIVLRCLEYSQEKR